MSTNKNSIASLSEQILKFNSNVVEIITKLDQAVSSSASSIVVKVENPDGTISTTQFPTLGYIQSEIDQMKRDIKTLAGVNGNSAVISTAQNEFKRIIVADLNLEPNDIDALGKMDIFRTDKNWFFDAMLNPMLSIELDLTGKVQDSVRKILSRRFIVEFEEDEGGNITTAGQARLQEFNTKYKGRDDVNMVEFVSWLGSEGIANRTDPLVDEQVFDLQPHRLQFNGYFTVLRQDVDTLNRKLWYILDTLNYQDVSNTSAPPVSKTLKPGDKVAVVPNDSTTTSTTVYTVIEVSTATSEFRVRFERDQGEEPIPVRVSALRIYSPVVYQKTVRISIGFNEYDVVFVKPLNADNNLLAKNWSSGTGFYTSELRLDSTSGLFLEDFYIQKVYDYGAILQDLVAKKIPTAKGLTPNAPKLDTSNFKVVQINKHLTDTPDAEKVRSLHNNKNTVKSEIDQIQKAISSQTTLLATKNFTSDADRKQAQQTLDTLTNKVTTSTARYKSLVSQIISTQKDINKIAPIYHLRGFWVFPDAVTGGNTQPQEVVQFEYQIRRSNISGSENPITTFKNIGPAGATAAFSNWQSFKSDVRKRTYNPQTGVWTWVIEDVSDADTPNINQFEAAINPGEQIEIRVRSISEVGYPEAPLISDWSNTITIPFPTDLNSVLADDNFILTEATQDDTAVRVSSDLDAKGYTKHIQDSFVSGTQYYSHELKSISSGIKDASGNLLTAADMVATLLSRIEKLEQQILFIRGELKVTLIRTNADGVKEIPITNGSSNNFVVELENLIAKAQFGTVDAVVSTPYSRIYSNETRILKEFKLRIENGSSDNVLGLLSNKTYDSTNTKFAYNPTTNPQATWVDTNNKILFPGSPSDLTGVATPKTQQDNQWLWLKYTGDSGNTIYWADYPGGSVDENISVIKYVHSALKYNSAGNYGLRTDFSGYAAANSSNLSIPSMADTQYWKIYKDVYSGAGATDGDFAVTLHPQINSLDDITDKSSGKAKLIQPGAQGVVEIPLMAYWKFNTIDELLDQQSTWFTSATYRDDKETVIRQLMTYLTVSSITLSNTTTVTFRTNGTGYSATQTGSATTHLTGSGNDGLTVNLTASGGAITAFTAIGAGGTGYAVGDIFSVTTTGSNGYGIVTKVNAGVVQHVEPVTLYTLKQMGFGVDTTQGDYVMLDGAAGTTEINNRLMRLTTTASSILNTTTSLTFALNSSSFTAYTSGALMAMITHVTQYTGGSDNGVQIWNSIGRDITQNAPITQSAFVVANNGLKTARTCKRSLAFYLEPENSARAFEFTINITFRQYKDVTIITSGTTTSVNQLIGQ